MVKIEANEAQLLLSSESVPFEQFCDTTREVLLKLDSGCCILVINLHTNGQDEMPLILPFCAWKGKTSMRAYIAKNERIHFLRICGFDVNEEGIN